MILKKLESKICYKFRDINLLKLALIHKSSNNKTNNERLEFLGDSNLNSAIQIIYIVISLRMKVF